MIGRILCRLGLHKWEFWESDARSDEGTVIHFTRTTWGRCRRPGCEEPVTFVNREDRTWPKQPA